MHTPITPETTQDSFGLVSVVAFEEIQAKRAALARQSAYWRKRSKMIKQLRLVFPGLIVAIIALIIGWITVQTLINKLNIYSSPIEDIRMINPRFFGRTDAGEHYEISGLEAIRKGKASAITQLKAPNMIIKGGSAFPKNLNAFVGIYDSAQRTMIVSGRVLYSGGDSKMQLATDRARVELANDKIIGDGPVDATWASGKIHGESFTVFDGGSRIVFNGSGDKKVSLIYDARQKPAETIKPALTPTTTP